MGIKKPKGRRSLSRGPRRGENKSRQPKIENKKRIVVPPPPPSRAPALPDNIVQDVLTGGHKTDQRSAVPPYLRGVHSDVIQKINDLVSERCNPQSGVELTDDEVFERAWDDYLRAFTRFSADRFFDVPEVTQTQLRDYAAKVLGPQLIARKETERLAFDFLDRYLPARGERRINLIQLFLRRRISVETFVATGRVNDLYNYIVEPDPNNDVHPGVPPRSAGGQTMTFEGKQLDPLNPVSIPQNVNTIVSANTGLLMPMRYRANDFQPWQVNTQEMADKELRFDHHPDKELWVLSSFLSWCDDVDRLVEQSAEYYRRPSGIEDVRFDVSKQLRRLEMMIFDGPYQSDSNRRVALTVDGVVDYVFDQIKKSGGGWEYLGVDVLTADDGVEHYGVRLRQKPVGLMDLVIEE